MREGAMRAVYANVLVRQITRDDSRQTLSAESFIEKSAWVLALAEAAWVLATVYNLGSQDLARAIEMLDHRHLALQDPETVAGALELFRVKPGLSFPDCLMLP